MTELSSIAVIGLGYVGLPVAVALARRGHTVVGFDIDERRILELAAGRDRTGEIKNPAEFSSLVFTSAVSDLAGISTYIITVPTPIDANRQPDLRPLESASRIVGGALSRGALVVVESTVYPGVTEEVCGPILAAQSGLTQGVDFNLAYSPERINPGDTTHRLENVTKVVSGDCPESLDRVAALYASIVDVGVHRAPSIKVAEAAKIIENTQRDLNIALMNELALIFDRLGICTRDVLEAAGTKWNFLPFVPGLVGGHCIGVDPYYLTAKAQAVGYHPEVILAGRRINDDMGKFIAQKLIKLLIANDLPVKNAKVSIFGLTFKENVPDLRNSRVIDIIAELKDFGVTTFVHDPLADPSDARAEYGVHLVPWNELPEADAALLAVPHEGYVADPERLLQHVRPDGVFADVKSALPQSARRVRPDLRFWTL